MLAPMMVLSISTAKLQRPIARTRLFFSCGMALLRSAVPTVAENHEDCICCTNNEFLDTRGLPSPVTGARAGYILQRLADASKPFGTTVEIKGDTAEIKLKGN